MAVPSSSSPACVFLLWPSYLPGLQSPSSPFCPFHGTSLTLPTEALSPSLVTCHFGLAKPTPARRVGTSAFLCVSSPSPVESPVVTKPGSHRLHHLHRVTLSFNGQVRITPPPVSLAPPRADLPCPRAYHQDTVASAPAFEVYMAPILHRLTPAHGPVGGRTALLVHGGPFETHHRTSTLSMLACRFGGVPVAATRISARTHSITAVLIPSPHLPTSKSSFLTPSLTIRRGVRRGISCARRRRWWRWRAIARGALPHPALGRRIRQPRGIS